jgi:hypothetical protein
MFLLRLLSCLLLAVPAAVVLGVGSFCTALAAGLPCWLAVVGGLAVGFDIGCHVIERIIGHA